MRQHILQRRRTKLLGVEEDLKRLFDQLRTYLKNMWTVPLVTRTYPSRIKSQKGGNEHCYTFHFGTNWALFNALVLFILLSNPDT
ncbi:hypothetical protein I7I48_03028 [Histoplasma ohiense]|nr:hypothetical protein I7I48_03028 [Histoplasma ohiense (nom. inval.)]